MRIIWIDRVTERYFSESLCKFVVLAKYRDNGVWRFGHLFFDTREEFDRAQEGTHIKYGTDDNTV